MNLSGIADEDRHGTKELSDPAAHLAGFSGQDGSPWLPAAAFRSAAFAALEDNTVWARSWVYVGVPEDIPRVGDVLPYTVGTYGLHVERVADNRVEGRFNRAQQGGCGVIPLQCQSGRKMSCPQTACGFSRDREPIRNVTRDDDSQRALLPFRGSRPEMLPRVAAQMCGGLIMINLASPVDVATAAHDAPGFPPGWKRNEEARVELGANWKIVAICLAAGADSKTTANELSILSRLEVADECVQVSLHYPNLVIWRTASEAYVAVLQPVGPTTTLCRISSFSRAPQNPGEIRFDWHDLLCQRRRAAEEAQRMLSATPVPTPIVGNSLRAPQHAVGYFLNMKVYASTVAPDARTRKSPLTRAYRVNPRFGFAG